MMLVCQLVQIWESFQAMRKHDPHAAMRKEVIGEGFRRSMDPGALIEERARKAPKPKL